MEKRSTKCVCCGNYFLISADTGSGLCEDCNAERVRSYGLSPEFQKHHEISEEIANLLDQKRADYGVENIKRFGSNGILVRVSDKVERLINLSRKEGVVLFESVEDTWKDIAGYAVLALIELREGR